MATAFLIAGATWVLATDVMLSELTDDPAVIARIGTAKGWVFVGLSAVLLYMVTMRATGRLRRAHRLLSAIVESIADGVLLLGSERTIVYANPAARRLLHCEGSRDLIGMGAPEFSRRFRLSYPDGARVPPHRFVSQRVFTEGGPLQYKVVAYPVDDRELVISSTAAAVRDEPEGPPEYVVSVLHDITASENLDRERDRLFAAAAHSLKTPISIIKANVQVLARDSVPRIRKTVAGLERQCLRIERLIQNLLVFSRYRSRTLKYHQARIELRPLVAEVVRQTAAVSRGHAVAADLIGFPFVHADQERLCQALRNLADHALRSAAPGSPITVELRPSAQDIEVGFRYRPPSPHERTSAILGEWDEDRLGQCVTRLIVEAHGGSQRKRITHEETVISISVPSSNGRNE